MPDRKRGRPVAFAEEYANFQAAAEKADVQIKALANSAEKVAKRLETVSKRLTRGRPPKPESERLFPLSTNLSQGDYAAVCRLAKSHDLKVSEVIRRIIVGRLKMQPVSGLRF